MRRLFEEGTTCLLSKANCWVASVVVLALLSHFKLSLLASLPVIDIVSNLDLSTVLAALIGITGYIIDARNSRASEIRSLHVSRAQSQFAELLTPLNINYQSMMLSLFGFIGAHIDTAFGPNDSGEEDWTTQDAVIRRRVVHWVWMAPEGLMQQHRVSAEGRRPCAVSFELPSRLVEAIAADVNGPLGAAYRRWIRNEWVPSVEQIARRIDNASHFMETIPTSRLKELYGPGIPIGTGSWDYTPRGLFLSWWLAYARGWRSVMEGWEKGEYQQLRPDVGFPVGLYFFVVEGQTIVGNLLKDLTGQSQMHGSLGRNFHSKKPT